MRPDQGWAGAAKERWESAGRKKPPPSRTSWPELAWIPGHTGTYLLGMVSFEKGCRQRNAVLLTPCVRVLQVNSTRRRLPSCAVRDRRTRSGGVCVSRTARPAGQSWAVVHTRQWWALLSLPDPFCTSLPRGGTSTPSLGDTIKPKQHVVPQLHNNGAAQREVDVVRARSTCEVGKLLFLIGFDGKTPKLPVCVSDSCRDFLNKCLHRDAGKRWSCDELVHHPFLSSTDTHDAGKPSPLPLPPPAHPKPFLAGGNHVRFRLRRLRRHGGAQQA
uniref:Protein kinase domain-containing protein n=1 Tax=Oryza barthii TaxID=65489 RepID=A0A0D3EW17_9ORYZ